MEMSSIKEMMNETRYLGGLSTTRTHYIPNKLGVNLWHKLKSRFLLSLLLATGLVLISCGGGGGGSGPTATTQPPSPPTQIIGRLNNLGSVQIGDFRFVPAASNITLRWTNPASPRAAISGFIITIRGMSSRTGGTQVSIDTQPIPYSGNGNPQTYSFRGLNGALYYEADFQVVYTDNTGSAIIAVLTEIGSGGGDRRGLGKNTDGDDLADKEDDDDDNDLVLDGPDNCQFDANPSQSDADGDGMGNACDSDAFTGNGGNAGGLTAIVNSGTQVTLVWNNPSLTGNLADHDMTKVTLIRAGASRSSKDITRQTTVFTSSDASSSYRVTGLTASSAYTFTVEIEFTDKDGEVVTGNRPTPISVNTLAAPTATPTDSDGDGHSNNVDNCPNNANRNQGDADGDAVAGTGGGNVCDTTPAGAGIHVTQLARTVNSDTEVTLTWRNPALSGHLANHQISKVTLIRAGASSASTVITAASVTHNSAAQSTYIVTGLTASSTYTFTVELEFTDGDRFSFDGGRPTPISATTNAATITPPPVIPPPVIPTPTDTDGDTIVNNLDNCPNDANRNQGDADGDAVAGTGGGNVCDNTPAGAGIHVTQLTHTVNSDTQVTLTWRNPMLSGNLANHTISKVTLIRAGASSASTDITAVAGVTSSSAAQSTYIVTGLTASSTYTFTVELEFTDRDSFSFAGGSPTPISATTNAATVIPTDSDSDTIANNLDNCPNNANRNQDDADGDRTGNICDATPAGSGIHVTQLARTVNSDTQVTLTWSNPTLSGNLANHNISKVTLIRAGASSASTDITALAGVTRSSAASSTYIVSGLTASSTYTFTIQLEFTDRDSFSFAGGSPTPISATTNAATVIPMDSDSDTIVNNLDNCPNDANLHQGDADGDRTGNACDSTPAGAGIRVRQLAHTVNSDTQVTLTWRNPALTGNRANHTISKVTLIRAGASSASTDITAVAGVMRSGIASSTYIVTGLTASSTYTFTVELEFTDRDSFSFAGGSPTPISATTNAVAPVIPIDSDGDQVPDDMDNCISVTSHNPAQSDFDMDDIGNPCDTVADTDNGRVIGLSVAAATTTSILLSWTNPAAVVNHSIQRILVVNTNASTAKFVTDPRNNALPFGANFTSLQDGLAPDSVYVFNVSVSFIDVDDATVIARGVTLIARTLSQSADTDNDMILDHSDIDVDGDGLIEISTAAEFNAIRNNLAGTGLTLTAGGTDNMSGCPSTGCVGYELTADLDLAAGGYTNWTPIGSCDSATNCPADKAFNGTFDGNGNTISNLNIALSAASYGVGLFGSSSSPEITNLNLENVGISSSTGGNFVGSLVGHNSNGNITNIMLNNVSLSFIRMDDVGGVVGRMENGFMDSVSLQTAADIVARSNVGGLVGRTLDTSLTKVRVVSQGTIEGFDDVGGIAGEALLGDYLTLAYVDVNSIVLGSTRVGGLVGRSSISYTSSSFVRVGQIRTRGIVGGLVGELRGDNIPGVPAISSSMALVDTITVTANSGTSGGLLGSNRAAGSIVSSVAVIGNITGTEAVGALLGEGAFSANVADASTITSSYALADMITGTDPDTISHLLGNDVNNAGTTVTASYHNVSSIQPPAANSHGEDKSHDELRTPTDFTGTGNIYATWANNWCDPATGEFTTDSSSALASNANRVWNLGTNAQLPVLNCLSAIISLPEQRAAVRAIVDRDGDGVFNVIDPIPYSDPAVVAAFLAGGGIDDGDGYVGTEDALPNDATEHLDTDGDGFGDNADTCPSIPNPGASQTADKDSDSAGDACDLDDFGGISNGLIDINTADELNATRNNLAGTNLTLTVGGVGNDNGCPVGGCNGYELTTDIDLAAGGYPSWQPIGSCSDPHISQLEDCLANQRFSAIFDGNGYRISNLNIPFSDANSAGLFGYAADSELRNLKIDRVKIHAPSGSNVGSLVGLFLNGNLSNIAVTDVDISGGANTVGGLAGWLVGTVRVNRTSVVADSIVGSGGVGGLIGRASRRQQLETVNSLDLSTSFVRAVNISGYSDGNVGGLLGELGTEGILSSSLAVVDELSIRGSIAAVGIGGLVGNGQFSDGTNPLVSSSMAMIGGLVTREADGSGRSALVGAGVRTDIENSLAVVNTVHLKKEGDLFSDISLQSPSISASYSNVTKFVFPVRFLRQGSQPLEDLSRPTDFPGSIYADWNNTWCDPDTGEFTKDSNSALAVDANRVWDLGTATQLPAITCFGDRFTLAEQRAAGRSIVDRDGDGVPNTIDPIPDSDPAVVAACRTSPDAGCPDTDGDGYVGTEDPMPATTTANLAMGDPDGDRHFGSEDNCPNAPNMSQSNNDGDTYGDACDDLYFRGSSVGDAALGIRVTATAPTTNKNTDILISWTNPRLPAGFSIGEIRLTVNPVDNTGSAHDSNREKIIDVSPSTPGYNSTLGANSGNILVTGLEPGTDYTASVHLFDLDFRRDDGVLHPAGVVGDKSEPKTTFTTEGDTDVDGDTVLNVMDIDADGDGLIEISTASELNATHYNLAGSSLILTDGGTANTNGCPSATYPGTDADGKQVTSCVGYELEGNIDIDNTAYDPWTPIGKCATTTTCGSGDAFSGTFEGNGYTISGLNITVAVISGHAGGFGLFGSTNNAVLRNLTLADVEGSRATTVLRGNPFIGSLVGNAQDTDISNIEVVAEELDFARLTDVGGLAGRFVSTSGNNMLQYSTVRAKSIEGDKNTGGLVGRFESGKVTSSAVLVNNIASVNIQIGGLVGHLFSGAEIEASTVIAHTITGVGRVGGIVGLVANEMGVPSDGSNIDDSFVAANTITANTGNYAAGLVGRGRFAMTRSLALVDSISATDSKDSLPFFGKKGGSTAGGITGDTALDSDHTPAASSITATYYNVATFNSGSPNNSSPLTMNHARMLTDLSGPNTFAGIYSTWGTASCSPINGGYSTANTAPPNYVEVWDVGSTTQYPVLNCFGAARLGTAALRTALTRVLNDQNPVQ